MILNIFHTTLPIKDPVLEFLLILVIILVSPLLLNKIKIPHLLGLIIAGAISGPNGFNLLERDSSIVLSGTAGLLYIMFLAGLEMDLAEFKKNSSKSLVFGLYTFIVPMIVGVAVGYYILNFSILTSVLWASMFASHTLITYPIMGKFGVSRNRAVNIAVGGTMITDILALLILAVVVGVTTGEVNTMFWVKFSLSVAAFGAIVLFLFPIIGRWFFKHVQDNVSQYIFVLVMVYLGAILSEMAGIEPIIGAFLVGLALNRLIPHSSPLMNRVEFVGNAIFIPFFLIGVGMLIDFRAFFKDAETIKIAAVMVVVASLTKFIAAWLTQKTFKLSADERRLIFGLSNAQAAATLAAVLVGYNLIIGTTATGEPIRLLSESILNGTIIMILFTCTIASFVAQKGARQVALTDNAYSSSSNEASTEKILIPIGSLNTTDEAIFLGLLIKSKNNTEGMYALNVVDSNVEDPSLNRLARKILHKAAVTASSADCALDSLLRYDMSIVNGISGVVKEQKITDLIINLDSEKGMSEAFLKKLNSGILNKCNTTTLVYKSTQPLGTIKRHLVFIPENADKELGFPFWLLKIWNIAKNSGAKIVFYGSEGMLNIIRNIQSKHPIECDYKLFNNWDDFLILSNEIQSNDNPVIVMSRKGRASFHSIMTKIPAFLGEYFNDKSYLLIYPMQDGLSETADMKFTNASFTGSIEKIDEIGKRISKVFRQKT